MEGGGSASPDLAFDQRISGLNPDPSRTVIS